MDLRSSYPFWMLRHGIVKSYPSLTKNISTDVVVIGGGITGALAAWHLCEAGIETMIVDKRHIGMGSTAASTAMLQYEIDTPLYKLTELVGKKNAEQSYLACHQSIIDLKEIAHSLPHKGAFKYRPSLQFASIKKDLPDLRKELYARKKIGIDLQWMDEKELKDSFNIHKSGALFSETAAEIDPYGFTHALLDTAGKKGLQVFDHTEIVKIVHRKRSVHLTSKEGKTISAKYIIIACGYESQLYIPKKVQQLHATYAIVSEPFQEKELWYKNSLIWETATPYLYCRTTNDNRIMVGGQDDDKGPVARDAALAEKARLLEKKFQTLFPSIDFKTDFKWAGSFASTKDGLPYIGSIRQHPRTFFALGLGGNGITFSVIAAQMIRDAIKGKTNSFTNIFGFER
ncbi:MAG: FAD-dependent oxidoreductase [Agriterribacter sp.]